jgi:hypothetical protein
MSRLAVALATARVLREVGVAVRIRHSVSFLRLWERRGGKVECVCGKGEEICRDGLREEVTHDGESLPRLRDGCLGQERQRDALVRSNAHYMRVLNIGVYVALDSVASTCSNRATPASNPQRPHARDWQPCTSCQHPAAGSSAFRSWRPCSPSRRPWHSAASRPSIQRRSRRVGRSYCSGQYHEAAVTLFDTYPVSSPVLRTKGCFLESVGHSALLLNCVVSQTISSIICGILTGWVDGQSPPTLDPVKRAGPAFGYATWDLWSGLSRLTPSQHVG